MKSEYLWYVLLQRVKRFNKDARQAWWWYEQQRRAEEERARRVEEEAKRNAEEEFKERFYEEWARERDGRESVEEELRRRQEEERARQAATAEEKARRRRQAAEEQAKRKAENEKKKQEEYNRRWQAEQRKRTSKDLYYCRILGINQNATGVEILNAYRVQCKRYHPDWCERNGMSYEEANRKMKELNEAFENVNLRAKN
jgi:hypothetical protein